MTQRWGSRRWAAGKTQSSKRKAIPALEKEGKHMALQQPVVCEETQRLEEDRLGRQPWKRWGPYLSARQWGTYRWQQTQSPWK